MHRYLSWIMSQTIRTLLYGTLGAIIIAGVTYAAGSSLIGGRITFDVGTNAPEVCIDGICRTAWPTTQICPGTGANNTCYGRDALFFNTTGDRNTANGIAALFTNSTGWYNTANGFGALGSNTTGWINTANGAYALGSNNIGGDNTANGFWALYANTSGSANTANGAYALYANTSGSSNTANGEFALFNNTSGSSNTAIGVSAGVSITTGRNNTVMGYNAQLPDGTAHNQVRIGDGNIGYAGIQVGWSITSDRRWKDQIRDIEYGLDFINSLHPVSYVRKSVGVGAKREYGFIAQDVEKIFDTNGDHTQGMLTTTDKGFLELRYNDFFAPIVRAIQELSDIAKAHTTEITTLHSENDALQKEVGRYRSENSDIAIKQNKQDIEIQNLKNEIIDLRRIINR